MADASPPQPPTGVRIDWDDLEQALRRAAEAVRMTPRHVPGAIQGALGALKQARERLGASAVDFTTALAAIEAAVRAAGDRLVHADRWIENARGRLQEIRLRSASV